MSKKTKKLIALGTAGAAGAAGTWAVYDRIVNETLALKLTSHRFVSSLYRDYERVTAVSIDGNRLCAHLSRNDSDRIIVLVHDHDEDADSLIIKAEKFTEAGYRVMVIDQRGEGESEGEYQTCGIREQFDIASWIAYLCERFPESKIALYGVGTGALSCLLSIRSRLTDRLKVVIAENSAVSVADYLTDCAKQAHPAISRLMLKTALNIRIGKELGYDLPDAEVKDLNCSGRTLCFVAGDGYKDTAKELFSRCDGSRKYYPLKDGCTYSGEDTDFFRNILSFLSVYFN